VVSLPQRASLRLRQRMDTLHLRVLCPISSNPVVTTLLENPHRTRRLTELARKLNEVPLLSLSPSQSPHVHAKT